MVIIEFTMFGSDVLNLKAVTVSVQLEPLSRALPTNLDEFVAKNILLLIQSWHVQIVARFTGIIVPVFHPLIWKTRTIIF
jgi:hypothetical protein